MNKNQVIYKGLIIIRLVSERDMALTGWGWAWRDGRVLCVCGLMTGIPDAIAAHVNGENQFPEDLVQVMAVFIADHPQWEQCRLMQSSVAGLPFQQGCKQPAVVRHYLDGLFRGPKQVPGEPVALSR